MKVIDAFDRRILGQLRKESVLILWVQRVLIRELCDEQMQKILFAEILAAPLPPLLHLDAHRWLFSATPLSPDRPSLFDATAGLAVCGDWLAGGRVEGAFRSGVAAAGSILRGVGILSRESKRAYLTELED